jgi:hypothetical protein
MWHEDDVQNDLPLAARSSCVDAPAPKRERLVVDVNLGSPSNNGDGGGKEAE